MPSCRFIRREKEIAETRFEVAQVESLRYRQRVELLERELQELQDSLSAEREKVQVCAYARLKEGRPRVPTRYTNVSTHPKLLNLASTQCA